MLYIGFDLGDGESAITYSRDIDAIAPAPVAVNGNLSFVSAVGSFENRLVVGSYASGNLEARDVRVCFKRHFPEQTDDACETIRLFAKGVLEVLRQDSGIGNIVDRKDEVCFVVGCPAGWDSALREKYREVLLAAGLPNVKLVSESRAAFMNAAHCAALDPRLIRDSVLVIDIGSSTLDFAYVLDGMEYNVGTMGDVLLGGGLLDEMIVQYAIDSMADREEAEKIRAFLDRDISWRSFVMLWARALKEQYFTDEEHYEDTNEALRKVCKLFFDGGMHRLTLQLSPEVIMKLIDRPHPLLGMQSFSAKLRNSLLTVRQSVMEREPKLVLLTGGASRMGFFRDACADIFSKARIEISREPEFDISRGLVYAGYTDEKMGRLLREIREYVAGRTVEERTAEALPDLIEKLAAPIGDAIIENAVEPAFALWRKGEYRTLQDFRDAAQKETAKYLMSEGTGELLYRYVRDWSADLITRVQADIGEICRKYNIALGMLQMNESLPDLSAITGSGDLEVPFVHLINSMAALIVTLISSLLCGGTGVALVMTGPVGILIGAVAGLVLSAIGAKYTQSLLMRADFPVLMRKLVPEDSVTTERNREKIIEEIRKELSASDSLKESLIREISACIDRAIEDTADRMEVRIGRNLKETAL